MYQVGLMETDQHIELFWGALETFTQEELCKFIKFACNQERIPFTCPCKDGGPDTAHVPPYPMKIAPPDGTAGIALPSSYSRWDPWVLVEHSDRGSYICDGEFCYSSALMLHTIQNLKSPRSHDLSISYHSFIFSSTRD